ncbi:hypothetical protein HZS_3284 [Henneguya salminicola]|nr:hypothetical protein HZS_3284 [Henneguya salminicola]
MHPMERKKKSEFDSTDDDAWPQLQIKRQTFILYVLRGWGIYMESKKRKLSLMCYNSDTFIN